MTAGGPTTAQLWAFDQVSRRAEGVRFDVVDRWANVLGTLDVASDAAPSIALEASPDGAVRSLSNVELPGNVKPAIDFAGGERVRVAWLLGTGAEQTLGVFTWQDTAHDVFTRGEDVAGALVDLTSLLDAGAPSSYTAAAGALVRPLLIDTCRELGLPETGFVVANTNAAVADDLAWPAGTPYRTRLRALSDLAAFAPGYFDAVGRLRFRPIPDPTIDAATFTYREGEGSRVLADPPPQFSTDLWKAPTRYVAVSTNSTTTPVVGVFSRPASDPLSDVYRDPVTRVLEVPGAATAADATAAAKAAYLSDRSAVRWSFSTIPVPQHDAYEVVDLFGVRYLERSWSLELVPGGRHAHDVDQVFASVG